jgi:hypothetical protein
MEEMPNGQAIHITFDGEDGSWILMLHSVRTRLASELSEEYLDRLRNEGQEVPEYVPEGSAFLENEVASARFDSMEDLREWLNGNLDKLWLWMVGIEENVPTNLSA